MACSSASSSACRLCAREEHWAAGSCCPARNCSVEVVHKRVTTAPLLAVLSVHAMSNADLLLTHRSLCSLREHHRDHATNLLVVDNGSPPPYDASVRRFALMANASAIASCASSCFEFGALAVASGYAARFGATHVAILQHSMRLLRPIPIRALPCPLMAFKWFAASSFQSSLGGGSESQNLLRQWVTHRARRAGAEAAVGVANGIAHASFVASIHAIASLSDLFESVPICAKWLSEGSERLLAAVAYTRFGTGPTGNQLTCTLDGYHKSKPRYIEKTSHVRGGSRAIRPYPSANVTLPAATCVSPRKK